MDEVLLVFIRVCVTINYCQYIDRNETNKVKGYGDIQLARKFIN